MKLTIHSSSSRLRHVSFHSTVFGGLALLSFGLLPMAAHGEDLEPSTQAAAVVATEFSTEGRQLLAASGLLAVALVGMERYCSWRLGLRCRPIREAQPSLAQCLPTLPVGSSALLPSSPEVRER